MKKLLSTLFVLGMAGVALAQQPLLVPTPEPTPAPELVEPLPPGALTPAPLPSPGPLPSTTFRPAPVPSISVEVAPLPGPAPRRSLPLLRRLLTQPVAVAEPLLAPMPDPAYGSPLPYDQVFPTAPAYPLYQNVRVRQSRNIAPCAVPKLVAIKDPCFPCSGNCVYIEVCVPPCAREEVCCYRRGDKIRLDYGKYSVDIITTRRGVVIVDYND